jgi:Ala-tRNA(Pro) deacylase
MAAAKLKTFLDGQGIKYVTIEHSPAVTAPEVAASADISGRNFAKTVVVEIAGRMALIVLPANRKIVLADLRELLADQDVTLSAENDFKERFPDCEVGAMPPFGNLYGLPVYIAHSLTEQPEIAFNAGTHREVIKMSFADFAELVQPTVLNFAMA